MNKLVSPLLFGALLALPAFANTGSDKDISKSDVSDTSDKMVDKSDKMAKSVQAPEGFVFIEESVPVDLKQLPVDLIRAADNDFSNKNLGESAGDLRAAARVMRLEAKQAKTSDNNHLSIAADDLDKLASDVKNEVVKNTDPFHNQLAKVLYHDAAHHRIIAQREWDKKYYRNAGADLRASAMAAQSAAQWTDKDLYSSNKSAFDKANKVADQLTNNEGWSSGEFTAAIDNLSGFEDKLANRVMPSEKQRASEQPSGI